MGSLSNDTKRRQDFVDTVRLLIRSLDVLSLCDSSKFYRFYQGSPDGADILSSGNSLCPDDSPFPQVDTPFPLLATALRNNVQFAGWEPVIRKLLRHGADVHVRVPNELYQSWVRHPWIYSFPCEVPQYYTPLDVLFQATLTPPDGISAANRWLDILASEGYNVRAYLEREKRLRGGPPYCSFSYYRGITQYPRQLKFDLENHPPNVWWEWWGGSQHPGSLVLEEFKWLNEQGVEYTTDEDSWASIWPFNYFLEACRGRQACMIMIRQRKLCEARWERKQAKKLAKRMGKRKTRMPGAWCD